MVLRKVVDKLGFEQATFRTRQTRCRRLNRLTHELTHIIGTGSCYKIYSRKGFLVKDKVRYQRTKFTLEKLISVE